VARVLALALAAAAVAACGEIPPDPHQLLIDAGAKLGSIRTVAFDVTFGSGATILGQPLALARGKVRRPADGDLEVDIGQGGSLYVAEVLAVQGRVYFRPTQFLAFTQLSPPTAAQYPEAARLFDPKTGVPADIPKGKDAKLEGSESVDGHDCYRLVATYTAATLGSAFQPLTLPDTVRATFWIDRQSRLPRRARLEGHLYQPARNSFLDVHLHDFDRPVDIRPPA